MDQANEKSFQPDVKSVRKCVEAIQNDPYIQVANERISKIVTMSSIKYIITDAGDFKTIFDESTRQQIRDIEYLVKLRIEQIKNHYLK